MARKKTSSSDAEKALEKSLIEWGVAPNSLRGRYSSNRNQFDRLVAQILTHHSAGGQDVTIEDDDLLRLPVMQKRAIEVVFTHDLREYLDEKQFRVRLERENLSDAFEECLTHHDDPIRILEWPPKYIDHIGIARTKNTFKHLDCADMNPFERFTLLDKQFSAEQLAHRQCGEGWMNGYAFEAIVASYAIHHEPCYCCKRNFSLYWCGGSDTSWRDLYCRNCQSCFEIKSKKNGGVINTIFRFNNLLGGSYRRWCEEGFSGRRRGHDYIVLVNREAQRDTWDDSLTFDVEIARIDSLLPQVGPMTFVDLKHGAEKISLKSSVTMTDRKLWFKVPKQENLDFQKIFRNSFEKVFPNKWDSVVSNRQHVKTYASTPETTKTEVFPPSATNDGKAGKTWATVANIRSTEIPNSSSGKTKGAAFDNTLRDIGPRNTTPAWKHTHVSSADSRVGRQQPHRSTRGSAARSLEHEFHSLSLADRDGSFMDHYDDADFWIDACKRGDVRAKKISSSSSGLCKHNGYKMDDNGHYGKRRSGGKKGRKGYRHGGGDDW